MLPRYSDLSTCNKCGFSDSSTLYCNPGRNIGIQWCSGYDPHLHRVCGRCGYEWLEASLDTPWKALEPSEAIVTPQYASQESTCGVAQVRTLSEDAERERKRLLDEATDEKLEEALREAFLRESGAADKYREVINWLEENPALDVPEIISRLWGFKTELAIHHPVNLYKALQAAFALGHLCDCGE